MDHFGDDVLDYPAIALFNSQSLFFSIFQLIICLVTFELNEEIYHPYNRGGSSVD